jgi:hypothetical protein
LSDVSLHCSDIVGFTSLSGKECKHRIKNS